MSTHLPRTLLTCCVACLLAGCSTADEAPAVASNAPVQDSAEVEIYRPDAEREVLPSDRIYFTLTDHEWYARGEPLMYNGRAFVPSGFPIEASVTEMTMAGEYEGVEFYTYNNSGEAAVYVPVFQGYWQRFRADTSAPATEPAVGDGG